MPSKLRLAALAASFGLLLAVSLATLLGGCGGTNGVTGVGDVSGFRLVAFASDRGQPSGQTDILLWDYDATAFKKTEHLNSNAAERHPTLSSDGRFIAFHVNRGTGNGDDIEMYDRVNPSTFVSLPGLNSTRDETEPAFAGDALKLTYVQVDAGGRKRIRLYNGTTKSLIPLPGLDTTGVSYDDYSPAPNRDASTIAFVTNRNGTPDIYLYDLNQGRVVDVPDLLRSGGEDLDPSFSNNGLFLTFSSNRAGSVGGFDIYMLQFTTLPNDTLMLDIRPANSFWDERHPSVSDPGDVMVFQSNRDGTLGLFDLWNYRRSNGVVGRADGFDSITDDIEPSIRWPN